MPQTSSDRACPALEAAETTTRRTQGRRQTPRLTVLVDVALRLKARGAGPETVDHPCKLGLPQLERCSGCTGGAQLRLHVRQLGAYPRQLITERQDLGAGAFKFRAQWAVGRDRTRQF